MWIKNLVLALCVLVAKSYGASSSLDNIDYEQTVSKPIPGAQLKVSGDALLAQKIQAQIKRDEQARKDKLRLAQKTKEEAQRSVQAKARPVTSIPRLEEQVEISSDNEAEDNNTDYQEEPKSKSKSNKDKPVDTKNPTMGSRKS